MLHNTNELAGFRLHDCLLGKSAPVLESVCSSNTEYKVLSPVPLLAYGMGL